MKTLLLTCSAGALAALIGSAQPATSTNAASAQPVARPSDLFAGELVAKGKGVEIKRSQLDDTMVGIKAEAAAGGQNIPPSQMRLLEARVLQRLVQIRLLLAKATDADKTTGKGVAAQRYENIIGRAGGEDNLKRKLLAVGTTPEELRVKMTDECIAEATLERELGICITDDQARKYYEDNPAKFEVPERARAAHILLTTKDDSGQELTEDKKAAKRKQAEELVKRARAGEDFSRLVKEYSEDLGSKDKGGEYVFARASADPQHAVPPEFEAAAFTMKTNQVSDIVTTVYGYHVIKLLEKIPAQKLELAKIKSDLKYSLAQETMKSKEKDASAYLQKLEKDADVEILDERLKLAQTESPTPSAMPTRAPAGSAKKP